MRRCISKLPSELCLALVYNTHKHVTYYTYTSDLCAVRGRICINAAVVLSRVCVYIYPIVRESNAPPAPVASIAINHRKTPLRRASVSAQPQSVVGREKIYNCIIKSSRPLLRRRRLGAAEKPSLPERMCEPATTVLLAKQFVSEHPREPRTCARPSRPANALQNRWMCCRRSEFAQQFARVHLCILLAVVKRNTVSVWH